MWQIYIGTCYCNKKVCIVGLSNRHKGMQDSYVHISAHMGQSSSLGMECVLDSSRTLLLFKTPKSGEKRQPSVGLVGLHSIIFIIHVGFLAVSKHRFTSLLARDHKTHHMTHPFMYLGKEIWGKEWERQIEVDGLLGRHNSWCFGIYGEKEA